MFSVGVWGLEWGLEEPAVRTVEAQSQGGTGLEMPDPCPVTVRAGPQLPKVGGGRGERERGGDRQ